MVTIFVPITLLLFSFYGYSMDLIELIPKTGDKIVISSNQLALIDRCTDPSKGIKKLHFPENSRQDIELFACCLKILAPIKSDNSGRDEVITIDAYLAGLTEQDLSRVMSVNNGNNVQKLEQPLAGAIYKKIHTQDHKELLWAYISEPVRLSLCARLLEHHGDGISEKFTSNIFTQTSIHSYQPKDSILCYAGQDGLTISLEKETGCVKITNKNKNDTVCHVIKELPCIKKINRIEENNNRSLLNISSQTNNGDYIGLITAKGIEASPTYNVILFRGNLSQEIPCLITNKPYSFYYSQDSQIRLCENSGTSLVYSFNGPKITDIKTSDNGSRILVCTDYNTLTLIKIDGKTKYCEEILTNGGLHTISSIELNAAGNKAVAILNDASGQNCHMKVICLE